MKKTKDLEYEYLFTVNKKDEAQCLVCFKKISKHDFSIKRHYEKQHFAEYGSDEYCLEQRQDLVKHLKIVYNERYPNLMQEIDVKKAAIKASFVVSYNIAKANKPYTDGVFIKKNLMDVLKCFEDRGKDMYDLVESVPLSNLTITRRTKLIAEHITNNLKEKLNKCTYFSIALDESTDKTDISQLLIFIRSVDERFNVSEDFLSCVPMHNTTKGIDIYTAVHNEINKYISMQKLSGVCTDGAPAMLGYKSGFVGQLKNNGISVASYHCIIHQESLCSKSIGLSDTMSTVVKIVNKLRGGHNSLTI